MSDYTCPKCGEMCYPDDPCSCRDRVETCYRDDDDEDENAVMTARVAELEAALADAERRADVSEQLVADLSCGHGVATEHRAALARVAELEAALAKRRDG